MPTKVGMLNAQIKVARAKVHLDKLDGEIQKLRENPYSVTRYDEPDKSLHIIHVESSMTPDEIPCLAGEFAYQLRSSLDNLVSQLALLNSAAPPDHMAFYIRGKVPTPKDTRLAELVDALPPDAVNIIDSLHLYLRGAAFKDDPLWQLDKLCNIDKHRTVSFSHT